MIKNYNKIKKQASSLLALILICAMVMLLPTGCGSKKTKIPGNDDKTADTLNKFTGDSEDDVTSDEASGDEVSGDDVTTSDGEQSTQDMSTSGEGTGASDDTTKASNETGTTSSASENPQQTGQKPTQSQQNAPTTPAPTQPKPTPAPTTTQTKPTPAPTTTQPKPTQTTAPTTTQQKPTEPVTPAQSTLNKGVDATADYIISANIKSSMSAAEKVRVIHDYLVKTVDYDIQSYNKFQQTGSYDVFNPSVFKAEGALINKLAVCEGYSEAFKLLMDKLSIKCAIVYGKGNGGDHAWNMVEIDGYWYYVDVTFDDPIINNQVVPNGNNITYTNFLVPERIITKAHVIDKSQTVKRNGIFNSYPTNTNSDKYLDYVMMWEEVSTKEQYKATLLSYVNKGVYKIRVIVPGSWAFEWDTIYAVRDEYYKKTNIWLGSYSYSESALGDIKIWIIEFAKG